MNNAPHFAQLLQLQEIEQETETRMKPLTIPILIACGVNKGAAPKYADLLNELCPLYGINTHVRLSHFLGQLCHESVGLKAVQEYASGQAYEGRKDLGNTQKGDGVRFKGRGLIQLTGCANYTSFAKKYNLDCVNHPELLEQPRWALASALYYWDSRNLNKYADTDDVMKVTRIINGGINGLEHRMSLLAKCKVALAPLFV